MNQTCKVCGEPAAGFHFGAFTCEGCKSFFGRSYNNMNAVSECKNNNNCVINKKNRTACKSCRLRKCLHVGMSKSGSRYGRRSNWFKIHCLIQEQQQQQGVSLQPGARIFQKTPPPPPQPQMGLGLQSFVHPLLHHITRTKEELRLLGLDEYKNSASPCVSSPESHNSESSIELSDARRLPMFPGLLPGGFLPPAGLLMTPGYFPAYSNLIHSVNNNNNNNRLVASHNTGADAFNKRIYLDAILNSQKIPTPEITPTLSPSPMQEDPIDLSMKTLSDRGSSPANSDRLSSEETDQCPGSEADGESEFESENELKSVDLVRRTPLDLTTKM